MLALRATSSRPHRQSVATRAAAHETSKQTSYYIVHNVFKVKPESASDFEQVWKSRESHLKEMPGFVRFAMLRCENVPGKYISQTYWQTKEDFQAWTKSSQFAASHGSSSSSSGGGSGHGEGQQSKRPNTMSMLEGPPSPELFTTVTVTE
ncbi:hypothetical protein PLESTB_000346300 [Pleodorina starrii]|uniref:ABM domain-containing protein n=1 Tax=Pleodorina starrii TaxID=330485 RepID=A0A9W6BDH5_9CHLO|nr:hypothetical protein PLESTM_000048400 [Pleodorina starrii]GLC50139.1 hypothetical protein PLESTB_000346300 [Pleodorina starrii]GLC73080.1 hypothetical protein PLESTF_001330000 [Pleodorina starrii]